MAYEADRRIIIEHQRLVADIRKRTLDYVTRQWNGLGNYRDADIERFIARIVPVVLSGQKKVGQLTNSYLDAVARAAGFTPPPVAPVVTAEDIRGVAIGEVYRRPAVTVYTALAQGKSLDRAVSEGLYRLQDIVSTDMLLAHTGTARARLKSADGVVGFRRVLTGSENCALCALASTQRYHRGNLMPIHPGCDCTVSPIYGDHDPGRVINADLAEKTMDALNQAGVDSHAMQGKNRTAAQVMIRDHGEYGQTLTWRDQNFTGPADIS